MSQPTGAVSPQSPIPESMPDRAWALVLAAARRAERAARDGRRARFALSADGELEGVRDDDHEAVLAWHPGDGWACLLAADDERRALVDLYLPICSATADCPLTVGHLGESLDGFIATHTGDSRWVTGPENVVHMHRLRALCDAVVVGAGTVAADDPRLTTRLVPGRNPLRVVIDPGRRLHGEHRVFSDDCSDTLYVCAQGLIEAGEARFGRAEMLGVTGSADGLDLSELVRALRARGCSRVFVEGGGVTVSMFLQADLLDRLHLAIAPLLIGDGRAAIRLPPPVALGDCHRPAYRVFRMGGDVLFDCDLRARFVEPPHTGGTGQAVTRVI
ncbi:MAG TPA: RibD family protein [Vicinamibacterales bacterium]|jgi:riboflavin-specific deaminase-like protein|nr:RibD family protein [Vicinamibacterales bacterium]